MRRAKWMVAGFLVLAVAAVALVGCTVGVDPATGAKTYAVDPNAAGKAETLAEVGTIVAPFFGQVGLLIAGVIGGALAAWRKIKPSLTTAKSRADQYYAAAAATVTALEEFKTSAPEVWNKLGVLISAQLTKQGIDPRTIENVIRGLRGLPPKE